MNQIKIFSDNGFGDIRTVIIEDKVYFNATDITKALGYKRPNDAIHQHCKHTVKHRSSSNGGLEEEINYIPQSDVIRLVIKSKLPNAEKFESWVFETVIPDLITKGYTSIDNKPRYTLEQSIIALTVAYKFEDYSEMKETLKRIVLNLAKNDDSKSTFGIKIAKAYNNFYKKINWDNYQERQEYEQRCYQLGFKPLKTISKMDMCFFGKPNRLLDFLIEFILIENPAFPIEENIDIIKEAINELDLFPIANLTSNSFFEDTKSREVLKLSVKSKTIKKMLLN